MDESNVAVIRKAYKDVAQGNIPAVFAAFDATITWHVPGHSPLSGDFAGHEEIGSFFRRSVELSGGAFSIDVTTSLPMARSSSPWSLSMRNETAFPHHSPKDMSGE